MPVGTVSQETVTHQLKSLPPDGYVTLRQLSYWEMLNRRDKGSVASMESQTGKGKRNQETTKMLIESMQTWERKYTFANCIVDHNITDANGQKLNFSFERIEMTFKSLNPKIALEIEKLIDELNGGEDEEFDSEDFPPAVSSSYNLESETLQASDMMTD